MKLLTTIFITILFFLAGKNQAQVTNSFSETFAKYSSAIHADLAQNFFEEFIPDSQDNNELDGPDGCLIPFHCLPAPFCQTKKVTLRNPLFTLQKTYNTLLIDLPPPLLS